MKKIKILYLAFACNPYAGSEAQCGWAWVNAMRTLADVSVVTRLENKDSIDRYLQKNNITDVRVFYHDIPASFNIYKKTGKMYHLYYILWQLSLQKYVKKINEINKYDYIHHITLGDFRYSGNYGKLSSKYIFGPVGGAQVTPKVFSVYTRNDQKTERIRELINCLVTKMPWYRKAIKNSFMVISANRETQGFFEKIIPDSKKCLLLTENGVLQERLKPYQCKVNKDVITLLWSGRLVNKKGLSFLLDVLSVVKCSNKYVLKIVGEGPEKDNLIAKVNRLNLSDKVEFVGRISYEEMQNLYDDSDIFVFPSLRETTGTVLFEAMTSSLPIITFNQNGADILLDDSCGIKVNINQPLKNIKEDFAAAIEELVDSSEKRSQMGYAGYRKIQDEYVWEKKCKLFYEDILLKNL